MKKIKYLLTLAATIVVVASCTKELQTHDDSSKGASEAVIGGEVEKGWLTIKLKPGATLLKEGVFTRGEVTTGNEELDKIAASLGATEVVKVFSDGGKFAERRRKHGLHLWYSIRFDEDVPVSRASADISQIPGIELVEPIYKMSLVDEVIPAEMVYTPSSLSAATEMPFNDPRLPDQWHYNDPVSGINLFEAWKVETGKSNVIVSVHDVGFDVNHPDLKANMFINKNEIPGNGIDDDNNGYIDDITGWSFLNSSPGIAPEIHGTHVAGTVSAVNGNNLGVCGVAGGDGTADSGVKILPCHILTGSNLSTRVEESYTYAADMGAVISQNSWTYNSYTPITSVLATAFEYFIKHAGTDEEGVQTGPMKGGIILFASGNNGQPTTSPAFDSRVMAVGAVTKAGGKAVYTNYGPEIKISAPGGNGKNFPADQLILSTGDQDFLYNYIPNSYSAIYGTSMACPHVAGVAALIVSKYGKTGFTVEECTKRLLNGYRPLGNTLPANELGNMGVGVCDAAIALMDDPRVAPGSVKNAAVTSNLNTIKLSWDVPADGNGNAIKKAIVSYVGKKAGAENVTKTETLQNYYNVDTKAEHSITVPYNMSYDLSIITEDRYGNRSTTPVELSVVVGGFVNKAPQMKKNIEDQSFASSGDENKKTLNLLDYFSDSNIKDGDVMTFTVKNNVESVIKAEVVDGTKLLMTPLAKGSGSLVVTATDLAGESVSNSIKVTVVSGSSPSVTVSAVNVLQNPVANELKLEVKGIQDGMATIAVYDSSSRKVVESNVSFADKKCSLNVAKLTAGMYSVKVVSNGNTFSGKFIKK